MWRPEGWRNKYSNPIVIAGDEKSGIEIARQQARAFEAGADAMLKALIEESKAQALSLMVEHETGFVYLNNIKTEKKGHLVFIPDDEDNKKEGGTSPP